MRVFLAGGGTGGPTAPLLAVAEELALLEPHVQLILVGASAKLDKKILESSSVKLQYLTIPAGKWRRYFSLANFFDLFKIAAGFFKSVYLLGKYKPDVVFGAGSFVQVPVSWAAFFLKIPVAVHQQDVDLLLSTRLVAPIARAVTVNFGEASREFPEFSGLLRKLKKSKIFYTGSPVRKQILGGSKKEGQKLFGLNNEFPVILAIGGGTGSTALNKVILQALPELVKYVQVLHLTGGRTLRGKDGGQSKHYHAFDFLGKDLAHAYAAADLVISRGGMSTLSELARLGKPSITVPLPESPQEDNVRLLAMLRGTVGVFQEFLTPDLLVKLVRKILWSSEIQQTLSENIKRFLPPGGEKRIAKILWKIAQKSV